MEEMILGLPLGAVNATGIARLWLVPIEDVLGLVVPGVDCPISYNDAAAAFQLSGYGLRVAATATPVRLAFLGNAAKMLEVRESGPEGIAYMLTLECGMAGQDPSLLQWAFLNGEREWLAIWQDKNAQMWVGGGEANGLKLSVTRKTDDSNQTALMLTGRNWHPAFALPDADPSTLFSFIN